MIGAQQLPRNILLLWAGAGVATHTAAQTRLHNFGILLVCLKIHAAPLLYLARCSSDQVRSFSLYVPCPGAQVQYGAGLALLRCAVRLANTSSAPAAPGAPGVPSAAPAGNGMPSSPRMRMAGSSASLRTYLPHADPEQLAA